MGHIYGILNEAAGYKADQNEAARIGCARSWRSVSANEVVTKDDFRCKILTEPHAACESRCWGQTRPRSMTELPSCHRNNSA